MSQHETSDASGTAAGRGAVGTEGGPSGDGSPAGQTLEGRVREAAARARTAFAAEAPPSLGLRRERLRALGAALDRHEGRLLEALRVDLGRSDFESYQNDVGFVKAGLKHALANLERWTGPRRVKAPLALWPASAEQLQEPLGVALVIAPWNYPVNLLLSPLVGALAAGCTAVLKPSELAPHTAEALAACIGEAFGRDGAVTLVQGGPDASAALLAERWDVIFFTGSARVGRIVLEAAARSLTPTVLELGGKSPCIVDEDVDVEVAARRIAWGKFTNAGQTCIAPDYVLAHRAVVPRLVAALGQAIRAFYGAEPARSPDYARIVNAAHHRRLVGLLGGGRVVAGGQHDEATRYLAPTVLTDVDSAHPLMQDEIFGPLLPVIAVRDVAAAIEWCRARPKPLALYVFSRDRHRADEVLRAVSAGGAVVNDCVLQVACEELPFGGVGESGMGAYHGRAGVDAFSHWKSVVRKPYRLDLKVRYPPYTLPLDVLRRLLG